MGNVVSKVFNRRAISAATLLSTIAYLFHVHRRKRLGRAVSAKADSNGFDGKGKVVVETICRSKSFDDQAKHAKEHGGRLLTVSEAKAYIRAVTSLDCGEAKFFAVYKENNLQGKAWICAQGSKTFKCTSGQTHVEAYGSEAQWGDCQWTDPHGHKIGPGTDLVVYRLSKGINADASAKVSATAALWKIVWPKNLGDAGVSQLISIVFVNLVRVICTYFMTQNQRQLGYNIMSGKPDIYYPLFRIQLLCHFVLSVVNQYGNYCARNLGLIFKQNSRALFWANILSRETFIILNQRLKSVWYY